MRTLSQVHTSTSKKISLISMFFYSRDQLDFKIQLWLSILVFGCPLPFLDAVTRRYHTLPYMLVNIKPYFYEAVLYQLVTRYVTLCLTIIYFQYNKYVVVAVSTYCYAQQSRIFKKYTTTFLENGCNAWQDVKKVAIMYFLHWGGMVDHAATLLITRYDIVTMENGTKFP